MGCAPLLQAGALPNSQAPTPGRAVVGDRMKVRFTVLSRESNLNIHFLSLLIFLTPRPSLPSCFGALIYLLRVFQNDLASMKRADMKTMHRGRSTPRTRLVGDGARLVHRRNRRSELHRRSQFLQGRALVAGVRPTPSASAFVCWPIGRDEQPAMRHRRQHREFARRPTERAGTGRHLN